MVQNSNHFMEDLKKMADLNNNKELQTLVEVNSGSASPKTKYCTAQLIEQHNNDSRLLQHRDYDEWMPLFAEKDTVRFLVWSIWQPSKSNAICGLRSHCPAIMMIREE